MLPVCVAFPSSMSVALPVDHVPLLVDVQVPLPQPLSSAPFAQSSMPSHSQYNGTQCGIGVSCSHKYSLSHGPLGGDAVQLL